MTCVPLSTVYLIGGNGGERLPRRKDIMNVNISWFATLESSHPCGTKVFKVYNGHQFRGVFFGADYDDAIAKAQIS